MTGRPTSSVPSLRVNTPENKRLLIVLLLAGALLGITLGSFVPERAQPGDEVPPGASPEAHDP